MNEATKPSTPWHVWVVGILAILWHAGGANDYIQTQSENADYMAMMAESYGVSVQSVATYLEGWPFLIHATWAIGVWGGVLGSVLLLLRSRFAFHAFAASLIGMVVTFVYRTINPLEGVETSAGTIVMTVLIFGATALLIWYARAMTARGVLR